MARVGRKFELDQIQANSIQLQPGGWPNDTQLHRGCELGSSWLELGGPFDQGLRIFVRSIAGSSVRVGARGCEPTVSSLDSAVNLMEMVGGVPKIAIVPLRLTKRKTTFHVPASEIHNSVVSSRGLIFQKGPGTECEERGLVSSALPKEKNPNADKGNQLLLSLISLNSKWLHSGQHDTPPSISSSILVSRASGKRALRTRLRVDRSCGARAP